MTGMTDGDERIPEWPNAAAVKLWLSEHFAQETDAVRLLEVAAEAVGRFLGVSRVAYGEVDEHLQWMTVPQDWTDGMASKTGRRPFDRNSTFARLYREGRTLVINDIDTHPLEPDQIASMTRDRIRAALGVPLIDNGKLVAVFNAMHTEPRIWTEEEIVLVAQTGARIWSALQQLRMMERLRESEEQFRTLAENMPGLCWLAAPDGRAYWGNRKWSAFFTGASAEPGDLTETVHPEDFDRAAIEWERARATGTPMEMTLRMRGADGIYRPFLSSAVPIHDGAGQVVRWCGVLVDLSVQHAHDARLAFLRGFNDATRDLTAATAILRVLGEMLIAQLGIGQITYSEVTTRDSRRFDVVLVKGGGRVHEFREPFHFGEGFDMLFERYNRGETFVLDDCDDDRPEMSAPVRAASHAASMCAAITVPLVKEGRLVAMLSAADPRPRRWLADEVQLIEDVADRVWTIVSRARAEAALQARERDQAFLIAWNDSIRGETDPRTILAITLDRIGRHLGVSRANYAETTETGDALCVLQEWRQGVSSVVGETFPLAALGRRVLADHLSGQPVRVDDVATDPRFDDDNRPLYDGIGVGAFMSVPMVRAGEIIAVLSVQQDEERRWSDGAAQLLRDVADRTWSVLERALSEQRLAASEAQLAAFMENAPVAMHLKDAEGRYIRINPEFASALGRSRDDLPGRHPDELFPARIAAQIGAIERRAMAGEVASAELELGAGDRYGSVLSIVFPITGSAGLARTAGFTIDLTARKRAEAALARSRETLYQTEKLSALGSLLAGVSHELNNPLSIVVAQAVMMERQSRGGELAERAQKIRRAADRCARIVQTFLAMARQKRPEREAVDINAVAVAAHELADYGLKTDGIAARRDLTPSLPLISADADQLHQIIINLIVNAQQAMVDAASPDRSLTLRTRLGGEPDTVVLEVCDNGPGIPEEARRRIFEPFFTTKPQGQGTGVGLSFSQGLAEAHGGRLELVPVARGACFRLTLPVEEHRKLQALAAEPVAAEPALTRRALVVDDEEEIADSLADFLSIEGFACDVAVGGAAAKARLADGDYDLIVSDLRMPGMDGPQLHAWIAAERPDLVDRVAFATGDTLGVAASRFLETVTRPVLEKPFMPDAVHRFLQQMDLA